MINNIYPSKAQNVVMIYKNLTSPVKKDLNSEMLSYGHVMASTTMGKTDKLTVIQQSGNVDCYVNKLYSCIYWES